MAGLAEPIRLREFTNHHPQLTIQDVHSGMAPRRGKTLQGLYVGEVGRRHPEDPEKVTIMQRYDISIPNSLNLPGVSERPYNRHETTYNSTFLSSTFAPTDYKYTPTSHFNPLPKGAKSSPKLIDPTHLS